MQVTPMTDLPASHGIAFSQVENPVDIDLQYNKEEKRKVKKTRLERERQERKEKEKKRYDREAKERKLK